MEPEEADDSADVDVKDSEDSDAPLRAWLSGLTERIRTNLGADVLNGALRKKD